MCYLFYFVIFVNSNFYFLWYNQKKNKHTDWYSMKDLTKGNPLKLILLFAIPVFIGQLFHLFYSLVDTRIVGEILGESSLAAVGSTTSVSDLVSGFLNGLTNGFAIIIATYFGANIEKDMKKSIAGTVILSTCTALFLSIICLLLLKPILIFLNIPDSIMAESSSYLKIIIIGLLAPTLCNTCMAILRAIGDSFTPLVFLVIAAILNIILDYTFILAFHSGVAGAAIATVISQVVSVLLCYLYMKKKYPLLLLTKEDFRIPKEIYQKLISSGLSMGFMVSFVYFGTLALQTSINLFGTTIIVAHTAARKITSILMLPFSVISTTIATYCGQNYGAGKYSRIREGVTKTIQLTFIWCIFVIILTYTLAPQMTKLITATDVTEIISTATLYLKINTIFYFVPAIICTLRNSLQGIGDTKTPVFSSSIELIGKVLVALFLAPKLGYMGIIIAEPIVWFIMVIPLIAVFLKNAIFSKYASDTSE